MANKETLKLPKKNIIYMIECNKDSCKASAGEQNWTNPMRGGWGKKRTQKGQEKAPSLI